MVAPGSSLAQSYNWLQLEWMATIHWLPGLHTWTGCSCCHVTVPQGLLWAAVNCLAVLVMLGCDELLGSANWWRPDGSGVVVIVIGKWIIDNCNWIIQSYQDRDARSLPLSWKKKLCKHQAYAKWCILLEPWYNTCSLITWIAVAPTVETLNSRNTDIAIIAFQCAQMWSESHFICKCFICKCSWQAWEMFRRKLIWLATLGESGLLLNQVIK